MRCLVGLALAHRHQRYTRRPIKVQAYRKPVKAVILIAGPIRGAGPCGSPRLTSDSGRQASVLLASPFLGAQVLTSFTMLEVMGFPCLSMAPSATMIMFSLVPLERVWTNRTTACLTDACLHQWHGSSRSPWAERITVRTEPMRQLRH
jgi:hypothetical protein